MRRRAVIIDVIKETVIMLIVKYINTAQELYLGHNLFCGWLLSVLLCNFWDLALVLIPFSWSLIFLLIGSFLKQLKHHLFGLKSWRQYWICSLVLGRVPVPLPNPEVNVFTKSDHVTKFWHLTNQAITFFIID